MTPLPAATRRPPTLRRSPSSTPAWRWLLPVALALALLLAILPTPGASAATGPNLVIDGDAETAPGPAWVNEVGTLSRAVHGSGGYPGSDIIGGGTYSGGTYLFFGGSQALLRASQTIALSGADLAAVTAGTLKSRLNAFLGGYANQGDNLGLQAIWSDAGGTTVLTQTLDPANVAERRGRSGFLPREDVQTIPATATTVRVVLTGTRLAGGVNDGYVDNISLRLLDGDLPQLSKAFSAPAAAPGAPVQLTFTVDNTEPADETDWTFTDDLPVGMLLSATPNALSTCPNTTVTAPPNGQTVGVTGDVLANDTCTVTVDVVAASAGTYVNGASNVSAIGLRRPAAPATLVVGAGLPTIAITGPAAGTQLTTGDASPVHYACTPGSVALDS